MNATVSSFMLTKLGPKSYAIAYTLGFPLYYDKLCVLLKKNIKSDLLCGDFIPNAQINQEWMAHTKQVLALTLTRPIRTYARADENDKQARSALFLQSIFDTLASLVAGDIRVYLYPGCCEGTTAF